MLISLKGEKVKFSICRAQITFLWRAIRFSIYKSRWLFDKKGKIYVFCDISEFFWYLKSKASAIRSTTAKHVGKKSPLRDAIYTPFVALIGHRQIVDEWVGQALGR